MRIAYGIGCGVEEKLDDVVGWNEIGVGAQDVPVDFNGRRYLSVDSGRCVTRKGDAVLYPVHARRKK